MLTAPFHETFNGPEDDEDPREKGWVALSGHEASAEGVLVQAEVLHALGYEAVVPSPEIGASEIADAAATWDLVWFSDSFGFGVARAWAELIERDQGVEVRVHDRAAGGLPILAVRDLIRDDPATREELADAEIIVVFGNAAGITEGGMQRSFLASSTAPTSSLDPPAPLV